MEDVESICTKIAIIDKGKKIACSTYDQLKALIKTSEKIRIEIPKFENANISEIEKLPHILNAKYENENLYVA